MISRLCEAFGLAPTRARREWRRAPDLVNRVLQEREYAAWFHQLMHASDEKSLPQTGQNPTFDLVVEHHTEYLVEQRTRRATS